MSYGNYEFRYVRGHIEVFLYGVFQFSADTISEAQNESDTVPQFLRGCTGRNEQRFAVQIEQPYCADFSRTPALLSHQCSDDYDAGMSVSLPVLLGAAEPDVWGQ